LCLRTLSIDISDSLGERREQQRLMILNKQETWHLIPSKTLGH